jgi:hypothetical protein
MKLFQPKLTDYTYIMWLKNFIIIAFFCFKVP